MLLDFGQEIDLFFLPCSLSLLSSPSSSLREAFEPNNLKTGALGFEPRNGGTKTRCLTAWLRPIVYQP